MRNVPLERMQRQQKARRLDTLQRNAMIIFIGVIVFYALLDITKVI